MSLTHLPLTLIVAATTKNGIGKNGGLPWPMLKKDMAYFARVTKRVPAPRNTGSLQSDALKTAILDDHRQNVVIMGRKTWDSIPAKLRPLKDRTNIVISSQSRSSLGSMPDNVVVASDVLSGLQSAENLVKDGKALPVARAFIIGGSSIYQSALQLPQTNRILLTKISRDYECDTFFPLNLHGSDGESGWRRVSREVLQEYTGEAVHDGPETIDAAGDAIELEFQLFERS